MDTPLYAIDIGKRNFTQPLCDYVGIRFGGWLSYFIQYWKDLENNIPQITLRSVRSNVVRRNIVRLLGGRPPAGRTLCRAGHPTNELLPAN